MGSGFDAMTDGSLLAATGDVVYVSLNHRLNAMGFLYLGAVHDDFADSGNAGMLDIVLALAMGARQHRRIRRRSGQCDHLWPERGRGQGLDAARHASCQRPVPQGDRDERPDPLAGRESGRRGDCGADARQPGPRQGGCAQAPVAALWRGDPGRLSGKAGGRARGRARQPHARADGRWTLDSGASVCAGRHTDQPRRAADDRHRQGRGDAVHGGRSRTGPDERRKCPRPLPGNAGRPRRCRVRTLPRGLSQGRSELLGRAQ